MEYDELGRELPDPTPIEVPLRFRRSESLEDKMRRFLANAQYQQAIKDAGFESEEEAHDFDIDEDQDIITPHELAGLTPREMAVEFGFDEHIDPGTIDPSRAPVPKDPPPGAAAGAQPGTVGGAGALDGAPAPQG